MESTATTAETTVASLRRLKDAAADALRRARSARAVKLSERALAAAEAALPHDSLVVASLLQSVYVSRTEAVQSSHGAANPQQHGELARAAWRSDARIMPCARRCLALFHARWQAGSLFTPTPEEVAYFAGEVLPVDIIAADKYMDTAILAVLAWPQLCDPAEEEARVRGVYGALRTALELSARESMQQLWSRAGQLPQTTADVVLGSRQTIHTLVNAALNSSHDRLQLRTTSGLRPAEETALRDLAARQESAIAEGDRRLAQLLAEARVRAAADVARHGLRSCALPSCGVTEPHPKLFKLCGRCRGAAYCCAQHSKEDWKRHKREDNCSAVDT
jgi:hypothetical protein